MATHSQPVPDAASPLLQQLRQLLLSSGYCESGIAPTIDNRDLTLPAADDLPTPLNTLLRLFFMFEDVAPADVSSAIAPLTVDQLADAGVLVRHDNMLSSALRIQPYQNLLFAFPASETDVPPEESMMLVSPSSLEVAHLMTRAPVRSALDIGTGCGFLASLLAPFSDTVHAIDVNPAAIRFAQFNSRWNGLNNITFLTGDLLEPVRHQRFDLIVCNPPFLIAPITDAFSNRYRFKHSGSAGDAFCIDLARQASQLLNESGYFHMIFQWEEIQDQPWSSTLEKSFAGLGCDVWVARDISLTPGEHVAEWLSSLSEDEQANSTTLGQQALQYFQRKNIVATSTGLLTMRRVSNRKNYLWFDEAPDDRLDPYGDSVAALFETRAAVEVMGDAGLLQQRLQPSPYLKLQQSSSVQNGEWQATDSELALTQGLKYFFSDVDEEVLKVIADLSSGLTVEKALARLELGGLRHRGSARKIFTQDSRLALVRLSHVAGIQIKYFAQYAFGATDDGTPSPNKPSTPMIIRHPNSLATDRQ